VIHSSAVLTCCPIPRLVLTIGVCKLCSSDPADLQNSHGLPAGVYRILRDGKEKNPNLCVAKIKNEMMYELGLAHAMKMPVILITNG